MKRTTILLCTLLCVLLITACGSSLELPDGVLTPCDVETEPLGSIVEVGGEIRFIDDSFPDELYADLEADGCRIGLTVKTGTMQSWGAEAEDALQMGAQLVIRGRLDEIPLPARPDEFQFVVALEEPPQLLNEAALAEQPESETSLAPLQGPACDLSDYESGEMITLEGQLIAVDESAAAGIAGELVSDGCHVRLWVERRFWDEWTETEKVRFASGGDIQVDGLLTYVLNEAVVDIADPVQTQ